MPFAKVTVAMAIAMSPTSPAAARRPKTPRPTAMPPKNSIIPPSTAKNVPGCRWATVL